MSISNRNDGLGLAATLDTAGAVGGHGNVSGAAKIPDPETPSLPKRRRFSADYKARIVEEAEAGAEAGDIGALLRREGLYSSQLSQWRKQYRSVQIVDNYRRASWHSGRTLYATIAA